MEVLPVTLGASPQNKTHTTDFSQGASSETANVGFVMVPDTFERKHTETDANSTSATMETENWSVESDKEEGSSGATGGDLDSTGDSDRLVIAEDETDSPVKTLQNLGSEGKGDAELSEQSLTMSSDEVKSTEDLPEQGSHTICKADITVQQVSASETAISNQIDIPQAKENEATKAEPSPTALLSTVEQKLESTQSQDVIGTPVTDVVVERKALNDSQDVDSQSNASSDSVRDQAITAEKKRHRRKPVKVSKYEPMSEESLREKFDANFNSLEVPSEVKKESRLVNSFVAQAMKLWYDEELALTSPSKDPNRMLASLRPNMPKCKEFGLLQDKEGLVGNKSGDKVCKKSSPVDIIRSGVAPDDQYYSTPSPATPEPRSTERVQEYWTPGRCYLPTNTAGCAGSDRSLTPDNTPTVGTPLIAKAMQSVGSSSPTLSPSIVCSDQESPSAGPKRYFCSLCNKSFTFRTNLTRHQRAFHGRPYRRRTHDVGNKDDGEIPRAASVSSEDIDHGSDRSDYMDERSMMPKTEPHMDPNYGRFSPSVVSDGKTGRFSPSMPSPSASSNEPIPLTKTSLPPYTNPCQDFVVIAPQAPVSCSLCLTTFDSSSELSRHEPTCRGIDRSKLQSDSFGAIDLSKPKSSQGDNTPENSDTESRPTYKPKFHYNMAEMMKTGVPPAMEAPLTAPFLPNPGTLKGMPLLPHHLAPTGLHPHHLTTGLPLPFSPNGPGKRPYRCTLCTKKYSSFTSLAKHVGYVHKINLMAMQQQQHLEKESMAAMLAMANTEMKMLVEQDQGGNALNLTGEGIGSFPCKICGQSFGFAANLRTHYHTVHLNMKDVTGRDSASPDIGRTGTRPTEWVCDICCQNFASKRNLNRHLSHVHKIDRKREGQTPVQGGQATPVEQKPIIKVPSYTPHVTGGVSLCPPKDDKTSVRHLQDVIDRVVSADISLKQEEKPAPVAPTFREHPVKLPPKKAIMEEYQKEAKMKRRLEREQQLRLMEQHRASPASSEDSGVLNLSQMRPPYESGRQSVDSLDRRSPVMDLTAHETMPRDFGPVDLSSEKGKFPLDTSEKREYYPNPFSAILNLSQTYLRKLLNETPTSSPPPLHPDMYSTATMKDKENSINTDHYGRSLSHKSAMYGGRDYSPDTTSRLRDMLSSKGVGVGNSYYSDDSRPGSRNNSLPPSGRSTPVDGLGQYDRRPLVNSENQPDSFGLSEISPLRTNNANMMALKMKLMDQNSVVTPDWKSKVSKKRKNSDLSIADLVSKEKILSEEHEPVAKKVCEGIGMNEQTDPGQLPNVDSIKTGEFPAIAIGKRHICGLCGASFTFQTNLTRHQRKLHGKPFVRKSSINHVKGENMLAEDQMMIPLSMVPPSNIAPLSLVKQE